MKTIEAFNKTTCIFSEIAELSSSFVLGEDRDIIISIIEAGNSVMKLRDEIKKKFEIEMGIQ